MKSYKHLGEAMKKIRKEAALTQDQVSKLAGMHVQAVSNLERGKSGIPAKSFRKLRKKLNIDKQFVSQAMKRDYFQMLSQELKRLFGKI